jgi:hypothetical protein
VEPRYLTRCANGIILNQADINTLDLDKISIGHYDDDNRECRILIQLQSVRNMLNNYKRPKDVEKEAKLDPGKKNSNKKTLARKYSNGWKQK